MLKEYLELRKNVVIEVMESKASTIRDRLRQIWHREERVVKPFGSNMLMAQMESFELMDSLGRQQVVDLRPCKFRIKQYYMSM